MRHKYVPIAHHLLGAPEVAVLPIAIFLVVCCVLIWKTVANVVVSTYNSRDDDKLTSWPLMYLFEYQLGFLGLLVEAMALCMCFKSLMSHRLKSAFYGLDLSKNEVIIEEQK
jgi:hypothetical protein